MKFDKEARLRELAQQRLARYPGAYEQFINQSLHSSASHPVRALIYLNGFNSASIEFLNPEMALYLFDSEALLWIDMWAKGNLPRPVQPLVLTAAPPSPAPTDSAPPPPKGRRAYLLRPVIERAQARASDPTDHSEVFAILRTWATSNDKPAPVIGYTDGEGVKWLDGSDKVRWLNLEALRKRLKPRPPRSAAKRRQTPHR